MRPNRMRTRGPSARSIERVSRDDRVWVSMLPISDGLTLALKKA